MCGGVGASVAREGEIGRLSNHTFFLLKTINLGYLSNRTNQIKI